MSKKSITVLIVVIVVIVASIVFLRARPADQNNAQNGGGAISTADWKTYRNETYGFEVKYPDDWQFEETSSGFKFGTVLEQYNFSEESKAYGILDIRSDNLWDYGHGVPGPKISEETITISGKSGTKFVFEGDHFEDVEYPLTREIIYRFSSGANYYYLQFDSAVKNEKFWDVFDAMVSSIKLFP